MTRSRSAAVAVALCLVAAACSSGDDDGSEAQGSTTSVATVTTTVAPPTTTAAPAMTTTTAAPTTVGSAGPSTPEERAAVDAIDRWLELEDQAFSAGSTDAVIDELDALMADGSVAVQGSLDLGGPVERTSRARIDRIWHPDDGVTGLDVCKTIETPQGEARTAHTITATDGATPFLQNETVSILERDGITCPPDDIIDPVLATYERWMELLAAAVANPAEGASALQDATGADLFTTVQKTLSDLERDGLSEVLRWTPDAVVASIDETGTLADVVACRRVTDGEGVFAEDGKLVFGGESGQVEQLNVLVEQSETARRVFDYFYPEDAPWCAERLS